MEPGTIFFLIVGLLTLILGGDFLVRGASSIALKLHLSPLVVGLTIVAFGTSAPELFISVKSALAGSPDLTMGNVIGSNICNLALVLGITAVISPIKVQSNSIKIDWPMTMGSSLLLYVLVREGWVEAWEGILFIVILLGYTIFIIRKSRKETKANLALDPEANAQTEGGVASYSRDLFFIGIGCVGLYFGSDWFVSAAQDMARFLGVGERVIGLTVLALGTSLPELVTAIVASFKNETDLALGNLMGSNIFNILSILGITSIITDIQVNDIILGYDIWWMIGITLIILPMMMYKRSVGRIEGFILLTIYIVYTYNVLT